jgi:hypothetical protein
MNSPRFGEIRARSWRIRDQIRSDPRARFGEIRARSAARDQISRNPRAIPGGIRSTKRRQYN